MVVGEDGAQDADAVLTVENDGKPQQFAILQ